MAQLLNSNVTGNLSVTQNASITGILTVGGNVIYATINAAYARANTANTQANLAYDQANAAYGQANSARTDANSAANTARVSANSGSTLSAKQLNFINTSTVTVSVVDSTEGNANISFTSLGGDSSAAANTVRVSANSGSTLSQKQLNFVNTATVLVVVTDAGNGNANVEFTSTSTGGDPAAAYAQANAAYAQANSAYGQANLAYDQANSAYGQANAAYSQANLAYGQANNAYGQANSAYTQANDAYTRANTANTQANAARDQANTAYGQANAAYGQANSAYAAANSSANLTSVSANTGSIIYDGSINFNNSNSIIVSVTSGIGGNANVQFETTVVPGTVASAATITPVLTGASTHYTVTALATNPTINPPSGGTDGEKLTLRIKDNGSPRTLNWTTTAGGYRAVGVTLPTTTTASKVMYIGAIYNSQDNFWDVIAYVQQA